MRFILLLLLTVTTSVLAQRTQTIDADCLRIRDGVCIDKSELGYLDGSTSNIQTQINAKAATITGAATSIVTTDLATSMALQSDASGKVEASATVSNTELGYVDGATSNIQTQLNTLGTSVSTNDTNAVHKTGDESISGTKTFTGKLVTSSTTNGSVPCPAMTEAQRDLIATPASGDCVFNSTTNSLNVYNGTLWKAAGGGLSNWETTFSYAVGDIVTESDKIYQALVAHTSGTFATDLAAAKWIRLNDELTVNNATGKTLEVPYKQATEISTDKIRIETGNKNRLQDGGFENSIPSAYLTGISCTGTANPIPSAETTNPIEGKQSLIITVSGGASGGVCTMYQDADTFYALDGIVSMYVKSDTQAGVVFVKRVNGVEAVRFDPNNADTYRDIVSNPVLFKIPGAMGTTSTGVGVEVTVAASQTIIVTMDEAKVGLEDQKQVTPQMSDWKDLNITLTNFTGTITESRYKQVGPDLHAKIRVTLNAAPTGTFIVNLTDFTMVDVASNLIGFANAISGAAVHKGSVLQVSTTHVEIYGDDGTSTWNATNPITWASPNVLDLNFTVPIVGWSSTTEVYSAVADFFSTDTNTLAFKATAITDSDPVGTFNTYSYATSTNTKTICASAPTQTIADMKTNGILIYTRAYNAASTCGNPARVEVKIAKAGTSLPTLSKEIYKNAASITPRISGDTHLSVLTTTVEIGAISSYDASTGILTFDAARNGASTSTSKLFLFSDSTTATSGYLVINAQPKKTTAVADFAEFDYVYVKGRANAGQVITNSVTDIPYIEVEDDHNAWDGDSFTAPADGLYLFTPAAAFTTVANRALTLYINGSGGDRLSQLNNSDRHQGSYLAKLTKGDVVAVRTTDGGGTLLNNGGLHHLTITRIPGQFR